MSMSVVIAGVLFGKDEEEMDGEAKVEAGAASGMGAEVGSAAIVGQAGGDCRLFGTGRERGGEDGGWSECVCGTSGDGGKDDGEDPVRPSSLLLLCKSGGKACCLWGGL